LIQKKVWMARSKKKSFWI